MANRQMAQTITQEEQIPFVPLGEAANLQDIEGLLSEIVFGASSGLIGSVAGSVDSIRDAWDKITLGERLSMTASPGIEYRHVESYMNTAYPEQANTLDEAGRMRQGWDGIRRLPDIMRSFDVPTQVPDALVEDATFSISPTHGHAVMEYRSIHQEYYLSSRETSQRRKKFIPTIEVSEKEEESCGGFMMKFDREVTTLMSGYVAGPVNPKSVKLTKAHTATFAPKVDDLRLAKELTSASHFMQRLHEIAAEVGCDADELKTDIVNQIKQEQKYVCQGGRKLMRHTNLHLAPPSAKKKKFVIRFATDLMLYPRCEKERTRLSLRVVGEYLCDGVNDLEYVLNALITVILLEVHVPNEITLKATGMGRGATYKVFMTPKLAIPEPEFNRDSGLFHYPGRVEFPERYGVVVDPNTSGADTDPHTALASALARSINYEMVASNQWAGISVPRLIVNGCSDEFRTLASTNHSVCRIGPTLADVQNGKNRRVYETAVVVLRTVCENRVPYDTLVDFYASVLCPILETEGVIRLPAWYGKQVYDGDLLGKVARYTAEDMLVRCVLSRVWFRAIQTSAGALALWLPRPDKSYDFASLPASMSRTGYRFFSASNEIERLFETTSYELGVIHAAKVQFDVPVGPVEVDYHDVQSDSAKPIIVAPNGLLIDLTPLICAAVKAADELEVITAVCWTPLFSIKLTSRNGMRVAIIAAPSRASSFSRRSTRVSSDKPGYAGISRAGRGYGGALLSYSVS